MQLSLEPLFTYNHHTNQKLAALFLAHTDLCSDKAVGLFSHILNAHHIWNNRIVGNKPLYGVWDVQQLSDFQKIDQANYAATLALLQKCEATTALHYSNSQGLAFTNTVGDILFHIINHSTYHRAQIATDFKQSGLAPLVSDYIFFKRDN